MTFSQLPEFISTFQSVEFVARLTKCSLTGETEFAATIYQSVTAYRVATFRPMQFNYIGLEDYLVGERDVETKSELIDGLVYAMAGASEMHNTIAANLFLPIGNQIPVSVVSGSLT